MKKTIKYVVVSAAVGVSLLGIGRLLVEAQEGRRYEAIFKHVDADGDGKLSKSELSGFSKLKTALATADQDGDAMVSLKEYRASLSGAAMARASSSGKIQPGDAIRQVEVDSESRRYLIHVPASYDAAKPTPVVIAFHGGGGNPASMVRLSGLNKKSDEAGFIVVYPYGSGRDPERSLTFNGGDCCGYAQRLKVDDVGFTDAILNDLESNANIDTGSVFATGMSNGAIVTYLVASQLADRIAAIAPVGGPMMTDTCDPSRCVSVIHFHGTEDKLAPFDGGRGTGTSQVPAFMRPRFNSVKHSIDNWVQANGCDANSETQLLPDRESDGMRSVRQTWSGGKDNSKVVLIKIEGGGHTWPGQKPLSDMLGPSTRDFSANDLMWNFLSYCRKLCLV